MVEAKYSAYIQVQTATITTKLTEYYKGVSIDELRTNTDFILHVCNYVEATFTKDKKKYKVNKKDIALTIIKRLCPSTQLQDIQTIESIIEHSHTIGEITGKKFLKEVSKWIVRVLKKVLLIDSE